MSFRRFDPWESVQIDPVPTNENYGFEFPDNVNQFTKELLLFNKSWNGPVGGSLERWQHGLNIVRMLWSNEDLNLWSECQGKVIWNTYFLNVFCKCCDGRNVCFTGPAAASKTFAVAAYCLISFLSAPMETSALLSTTSGSSAERRLWGQIKDLFNHARFSEWIDVPQGEEAAIGRIIDYKKVITFDPGKEIDDSKISGVDLRNGVILIPIAKDSTGDNALDTIIGTHNKFVLWAVDELPNMMDGVMRPRANLSANEHSQFIGIGNASDHTDPHGRACEPVGGWDQIDESFSRDWRGRTLDVMFLHGEESPNDHPDLDRDLIVTKSDYPFPYLSSRHMRDEIAEFEGDGNVEEGRTKMGYRRMGIGFWPITGAIDTILTDQFVKKYGAHEAPEPWGADGFTVFWALDPAFTVGGDENILFFVRAGRTYSGAIQIVMPHDGIKISPAASNKQDYRMLACEQIARELEKIGAKPENGCMDAMNDGGLMYADLAALLNTHSIQALTSLGKSPNSKYHNWVTDYWYSMIPFIKSGFIKGFNTQSGYAKDLFARRYSTKSGKIMVETKDEMKERIKRSPDRGDACSYCCWLVSQRLSIRSLPDKEREDRKKFMHYLSDQNRGENDYFSRDVPRYDTMVL